MKIANRILTFILVVSFLSACAQDPYDTTTPEKFVEAMGQAGLKFEQHYPIPHFYEKVAAEKIQKYDEAGARAMESYDKLKNTALGAFPAHAKNRFGKLRIETIGGESQSSFSFSISIIGEQIASRSPEDYEFVSATAEGELTQITMKIEGNEITIPSKRFDGELMMFMDEENLGKMAQMTQFAMEANELFVKWTTQIESGEITEENLVERAVIWESDYMQILNQLN